MARFEYDIDIAATEAAMRERFISYHPGQWHPERVRAWALAEAIGLGVASVREISIDRPYSRGYFRVESEGLTLAQITTLFETEIVREGVVYRVTNMSPFKEEEGDYGGSYWVAGLEFCVEAVG